MDVPHVTGAAQRRKQRRIRSWWRHEQVASPLQLPLHSTTLRSVVEVLYVVLQEQKALATGRRRSTRCTELHEDRTDLLWGSGRSLLRRVS